MERQLQTEMETDFYQTRRDLEQKEKEVESLSKSMGEMEGHLNQTRCALKHREEEVESLILRISKMDFSHQEHHHKRMEHMKEELYQTRSDLKHKDNQLKSLIQRMGEMKGQLSSIRSDLEHKGDQLKSLRQRSDLKPGEGMESLSNRMGQMEGRLYSIRCALKHKDNQVVPLSKRMEHMKEELYQTRCALKHKDNQLKSLIQSVTAMEHSHQQQNQDPSMGEMKKQLHQASCALKFREDQVVSLSKRMEQMEEELEKTRSALKKKDEELQSFKDRVAADVALSMKTGKRFESMNSPVSRSRLKEMYEDLWMEWRNIKNDLKSKENPESVKEMIREKFKEAMLDMEEKKQQIDEAFRLDKLSRRPASERDQQYRLSTCQNLQLVLYHRGPEDADLKTPSSPHESEKPRDVMESFSSKCYWLGCLMALNNPPLHPDWENHPRSMDPWDFFPRNFTSGK